MIYPMEPSRCRAQDVDSEEDSDHVKGYHALPSFRRRPTEATDQGTPKDQTGGKDKPNGDPLPSEHQRLLRDHRSVNTQRSLVGEPVWQTAEDQDAKPEEGESMTALLDTFHEIGWVITLAPYMAISAAALMVGFILGVLTEKSGQRGRDGRRK